MYSTYSGDSSSGRHDFLSPFESVMSLGHVQNIPEQSGVENEENEAYYRNAILDSLPNQSMAVWLCTKSLGKRGREKSVSFSQLDYSDEDSTKIRSYHVFE